MTAKATISLVPFAGGSLAEIFQAFFASPIDKRKQAWMESVAETLKEVEANAVDLNTLKDNEEFMSIVMYASQIAIRNHKQAKLDALKNVVKNTANGIDVEENLKVLFLNLVDNFTELHLQILGIFSSPAAECGYVGGSLSQRIESSIPEIKGKRDVCDLVWRDLFAAGLVSTDNLHVIMSTNGVSEKRTTVLGDKFLMLIGDDT